MTSAARAAAARFSGLGSWWYCTGCSAQTRVCGAISLRRHCPDQVIGVAVQPGSCPASQPFRRLRSLAVPAVQLPLSPRRQHEYARHGQDWLEAKVTDRRTERHPAANPRRLRASWPWTTKVFPDARTSARRNSDASHPAVSVCSVMNGIRRLLVLPARAADGTTWSLAFRSMVAPLSTSASSRRATWAPIRSAGRYFAPARQPGYRHTPALESRPGTTPRRPPAAAISPREKPGLVIAALREFLA